VDGVIQTIVGPGTSDGSGIAALAKGERRAATATQINGEGLAVDKAGRPYWSTTNGQILRLASDGFVELVAGVPSLENGQLSGNDPTSVFKFLDPGLGDGGAAVDATLTGPTGLAFDSKGNLYISDTGSMRVRRVTGLDSNSPKIEAFAGLGLTAVIGRLGTAITSEEGLDAGSIILDFPGGLAFDAKGNLYVGELGTIAAGLVFPTEGTPLGKVIASLPAVYAHIRKISPDRKATTVAGTGTRFFADPTSENGLVLPSGLAIAPDGRLAVVDTGTNLIHILPAGSY
jgi:sugar lactone lactonase YvrE